MSVRVGDKVEILLKDGQEFKGIVTMVHAGDEFRVYSNKRDEARTFNPYNYVSLKFKEETDIKYKYHDAIIKLRKLAAEEWKKDTINLEFAKKILDITNI